MPILELYSTRNKESYPDIYQYHCPSQKLRVQIAKIIGDGIGIYERYSNGLSTPYSCSFSLFQDAFSLLTKEYGVEISHGYTEGRYNWAKAFLLNEQNVEYFLDAVELFCTLMLTKVKDKFYDFERQGGVVQSAEDAIDEINERMRRDGFGYEYVDGIILRVDQEYIHSEITKPSLFMLLDFEGARHEFISAHEHYRHGRYEESLNDCNKSIESLLKDICNKKGWEYKKCTINALVPVCMDNGLFSSYLQTQFSNLGNLLSQGVSTIRNNESAHGQGAEIRNVSKNLVSYALHLTATNILFISNSYKGMAN